MFGYAGTANISKLLADGVLDAGGAPLIAPYTGGEALRNPFNPHIFHVRAGYGDETEHMVHQVATLGMTRIAVMYQDDAFGKAGLAGVEAAVAKRSKMKLVETAGYERNTDQVEDAVKKIHAAEPQAIIMISVNRSTALRSSTGVWAVVHGCTTFQWLIQWSWSSWLVSSPFTDWASPRSFRFLLARANRWCASTTP